MLISLSRNQQRVISGCNNDLSVTRWWPFITHHLRCFLTKHRNRCPKGAQPFCGIRRQLQRLGTVRGSNSHCWYWGIRPAQPPSPSPTCQQTRKDFLVGRTWPSLWLKRWQQQSKKYPSTCFGISKENLFNFIFYLRSDFSQHGMVSYRERLERSKAEDTLFSLKWNVLFMCKAFLPAVSFHREFLNFRFWSIPKQKKKDWKAELCIKQNWFAECFPGSSVTAGLPSSGWNRLPHVEVSHLVLLSLRLNHLNSTWCYTLPCQFF